MTEKLLWAQQKAAELFDLVQERGILAPGVSEREASDAIRDLAARQLGVERHWHKRLVRAGVNTLEPYRMNPPERVIEADDIVFLDFGPVFEEWEADFGRTYVLGDDPDKLRLRDDLEPVFAAGRAHFEATDDLTGEQLFAYMVGQARERGWEWGGPIAGHLVGKFPHEKREGDGVHQNIKPGNDKPLRCNDSQGNPAHWILEVHLVDRALGIGGFYEELLTL